MTGSSNHKRSKRRWNLSSGKSSFIPRKDVNVPLLHLSMPPPFIYFVAMIPHPKRFRSCLVR
jgi:hypothetical protein